MVLQSFSNPTPASQERFGAAVAAAGARVAVGVWADDTLSTDSGAVYLYDSVTSDLAHTLYPPTPTLRANFGVSVAANSQLLFVGAPGYEFTSGRKGSVFVYNHSGSFIQRIDSPRLPVLPGFHQGFGSKLAVHENCLVIGAEFYDASPNFFDADWEGAAYIYTTAGVQVAELSNPAPATGRLFGAAVAVNGNMVAIGAPGNYPSTSLGSIGAVYLYSSAGSLLHTVSNPAPSTGDSFGIDVDLYNGRLAVSAVYQDSPSAPGIGAAYLYTLEGSLQQTIRPTESAHGFGSGVCMTGNYMVLFGGSSLGLVHLYDFSGTRKATLMSPLTPSTDFFGVYNRRYGAHLLCSAANATVEGTANAGMVFGVGIVVPSADAMDWEYFE